MPYQGQLQKHSRPSTASQAHASSLTLAQDSVPHTTSTCHATMTHTRMPCLSPTKWATSGIIHLAFWGWSSWHRISYAFDTLSFSPPHLYNFSGPGDSTRGMAGLISNFSGPYPTPYPFPLAEDIDSLAEYNGPSTAHLPTQLEPYHYSHLTRPCQRGTMWWLLHAGSLHWPWSSSMDPWGFSATPNDHMANSYQSKLTVCMHYYWPSVQSASFMPSC